MHLSSLPNRIKDSQVIVLYGVLCVHFQFFFEANTSWEMHTFSVKYLFEMYCIGVLAISTVVTIRWYSIDREIRILSLYAYIAMLFMLFSAIFAWIAFGQPIVYGLLETRRTITFLSVFYLFLCVKWLKLDILDLYTALALCFVTYTTLSVIQQLIFPGFLLSRDVPALDERKLRIFSGSELYTVFGLFSLTLLLYKKT